MQKRKAVYTSFIFCFNLFAAFTAISQTECGCREAEQLRSVMGIHFNSGRLDSAAYYAQKLLTYQEKGCKTFFQNWMAQISIAQKDFSKTREYLEAEKKLLLENKCGPDMYVRHFITAGKLYQELNQLDSLVAVCLEGTDAAQRANDFYGLSTLNSNLGATFVQLEQDDKAIHYYKLAIDAAKKQVQSPTQISLVQIRLGNLYLSRFKKSGNKMFSDSAYQFVRIY
jgi:tetratricopeptide (TPR) repeat protein